MSAFESQAAAVREQCRQQRELVLRHPKIARRLTQPPLRYAQPEQWTGYLPPEVWRDAHNGSPRRAALADIIAAAEQADRTHDDLEVF